MLRGCLFVVACLCLMGILGCKREEATIKKVVTSDERKKIESEPISEPLLEPVFDIPSLLKMSISEIKTKLGNPKSEFKPTATQWTIVGMTGTIEYEKGTTNIQIDYSKSGKVELIFILDNKAGRTEKEIMQLGNLQLVNNDYSIRIQNWSNPALAKAKGKSTIAGIEVKPKN